MSDRSELALLVEAENRLDGAIAAARQSADEAREAARTRALVAASRLETQVELERARIASTIAAETAQRERAIEANAAAKLARYDGMRDEALVGVARRLAQRLVAIAEESA